MHVASVPCWLLCASSLAPPPRCASSSIRSAPIRCREEASEVVPASRDGAMDALGDSEKLAFLLELGSELASVEAAASLKIELKNVHTALEVIVADNAEIKRMLHEILDNKRVNDKRTNEILERYTGKRGTPQQLASQQLEKPTVSWTGNNPTAHSALSVERPPAPIPPVNPPEKREALFAARAAPAAEAEAAPAAEAEAAPAAEAEAAPAAEAEAAPAAEPAAESLGVEPPKVEPSLVEPPQQTTEGVVAAVERPPLSRARQQARPKSGINTWPTWPSFGEWRR